MLSEPVHTSILIRRWSDLASPIWLLDFFRLSDQQQFFTDSRSGSRGSPNAVNRRHRRSCCCPAVVGGAKSTSASTRRRLGRRRHCLSYRFVRSNGPNSNFSNSTLGVLAIYCLLGGCSGLWCHPRHRIGDRDRCYRIPVGWLASALRSAGPSRGRQRLSRHHPLSWRPPDSWLGAFPLGCALVLRQCRVIQRACSGRRC